MHKLHPATGIQSQPRPQIHSYSGSWPSAFASIVSFSIIPCIEQNNYMFEFPPLFETTARWCSHLSWQQPVINLQQNVVERPPNHHFVQLPSRHLVGDV